MGFMTEICVLNDQWDRLEDMIRNRPEDLIQELRVLQHGRPQYRHRPDWERSEYLGSAIADDIKGTQFKVYQSHHADDARLYIAWRNSFISLDPYDIEREFGDRLNDPNDHLIRVIEEEIQVAERKLKSLKSYLKEKKEAR